MAHSTVKADRAFTASWNYQVIEIADGQEIGHELADYLLDTGAPVTEVTGDGEPVKGQGKRGGSGVAGDGS